MGISAQYSSKISKRYLFWCRNNILAILNEYFTNIKQAVILATYWNNMLHMSAQCYEHRFGYCTNAKTCLNVHFRKILAERRVLLGCVFGLGTMYTIHLRFIGKLVVDFLFVLIELFSILLLRRYERTLIRNRRFWRRCVTFGQIIT